MVKKPFLMFFDHCDVMLSFLYVSIVYVEFEKMVITLITILLVGFCARANEDTKRITNIFISEINKHHSCTKSIYKAVSKLDSSVFLVEFRLTISRSCWRFCLRRVSALWLRYRKSMYA